MHLISVSNTILLGGPKETFIIYLILKKGVKVQKIFLSFDDVFLLKKVFIVN